jgi:hypothetical protein
MYVDEFDQLYAKHPVISERDSREPDYFNTAQVKEKTENTSASGKLLQGLKERPVVPDQTDDLAAIQFTQVQGKLPCRNRRISS